MFGGNKRKGLGDKESKALHIVEFSQGKPNEISLNVLDNRASGGSSKKSGLLGSLLKGKNQVHPSKQVIGSDISAPDLHSVRATETDKEKRRTKSSTKKVEEVVKASRHGSVDHSSLGVDSQREANNRRRLRSMSKFFITTAIILVLVTGLGAGGLLLYNMYQQQLAGIDLLKSAVSDIEKSDEVVVSIDEFFEKKFDGDTIATAQKLKENIPSAQSSLDQAMDKAKRAEEGLASPSSDLEASQHAQNSIKARKELLSIAEKRLDNDIVGKQAYDAMSTAYDSFEQVESSFAIAAGLVADTTKENVDSATKEYDTVAEKLSTMKSSLDEVKRLYPTIQLDSFYTYIELRTQAIEEAKASNEAILIQDKSTAESHNDAYNQLDAQTATIIASFPQNFTKPVIDRYTENDDSLATSYTNERNEIASHDSFLREYLGNEGWVS